MASLFSNLRHLFFVKRIPSLHIPEDHEPVTDTNNPAYQQELEWQGFISHESLSPAEREQVPTLKQDLGDLEEHLMPAFWEFNQKAKHHQNRYYLYQWLFMGGAFVSTLSGTLTTYSYVVSGEENNLVAIFLGILTMLASFVTTLFTYMSQANNPQKRWAKARRLTEELRMNYFLYLSHIKPYDGDDRLFQMRRFVIDIRRKENDNG